ncbi:MAG: metal ABC transporter ATP-binding protein [Chloroflexi bacterium]|nr:metal ABC transporter ATP-binding protein [Chloroflexota bacterium]
MLKNPVLKLCNVSFAYGTDTALDCVSLEVEAGEFVALLGPNGAGKSTLVRVAVGLLTATSGEVLLFGESISRFRTWSRIGYTPQHTSARPGFPATVAEVVASGRTGRRGLLRPLTAADHDSADRALASVGMAPFRNRLVSRLSGGQHQRVLLARALASEPELLFLDEPAAGVDETTNQEVLRLLQARCLEANLSVVYVTHDREMVRPFATRVAILERRLLFYGTWEDLDKHPDAPRIRRELAAPVHHGD